MGHEQVRAAEGVAAAIVQAFGGKEAKALALFRSIVIPDEAGSNAQRGPVHLQRSPIDAHPKMRELRGALRAQMAQQEEERTQ